MGYEVIARKWRPQQFSDVVGQEHVVATLSNAIKSDRLAHAYLLVGPRGVGKTSVARILAKALNCEGGPTVTPCDACDSCREIMAGSALDVLEIDGASNNGVDQVRELRETVKYAPNRGKFKIYIIDEVHMLSTAAFNALLKTLEEPPPHVKFVFATTEPDRVLATIISRCQRFDLRRIPVRLIVERLEEIARDEKVDIDADALLAIARGSEGGLRDAESALDQLISFRGKKITEEDVLSVFGLTSRGALEELSSAILAGDIKGVIHQVAALDEKGKDLRRLTVELLEHFRNLLVVMHVEDAAADLDLTDTQVERLRAQTQLADAARLLRVTDILTDTEDRLRTALSRRTLLETALIRSARAATVASIEDILRKLNAMRGAGQPAAPAAAPKVVRAEARQAPLQVREQPVPYDMAGDLDTLRNTWSTLAEEVGKIAPLARAALGDAGPTAVTETQVAVSVEAEFAEQADVLNAKRNHKALNRVLSRMLGRDVTAQVSVAGPAESVTPGAEKLAASEVAADAGEDRPQASGAKAGASKSRREWAKDPAVQKTLDAFEGTILDVRE